MQKIVFFLFALVAFSANAYFYTFEDNGIYYRLTSTADRECEVSNGENKYEGNLVIPETVEYKGIKLNVTGIGEYAFSGSSDLESVTFPASLKSLEFGVFNGCTGLSNIFVCPGNQSYSDIEGVLFNASQTCIIKCGQNRSGVISLPSTVTSVGSSAFMGCSHLSDVILNDGLEIIEDYAFSSCSLEKVTLPHSVKELGKGAFSSKFIKDITLNENLSYIGESAFSYTSISQITIPSCVTKIDNFAFYHCDSLVNIEFSDGDSQLFIGYSQKNGSDTQSYRGMFIDIPLEQVYIGRELKYRESDSWGYSPFCNVKTLKKAVFSDCAKYIPNYIFYDCTSLSTVITPNHLTSIGDRAFCNCYSLNEFNWGHDLTTIGFQSFWCVGINEISFPETLREIGDYAFSGSRTKSVTFNGHLNSIGKYCFTESSLETLNIDYGATQILKNAFENCSNLAKVIIGPETNLIESYVFWGCKSLTDIYCYNETAPTIQATFDTDTYTDASLYIPVNSIQSYNDTYWKNFWHISDDLIMPIATITFVENPVNVYIGDSIPLQFSFSPNSASIDSISWTSEDESIAIVDNNGMVSGIGEGETYILAFSRNVKSYCKIIVSQKPILIEQITLNFTEVNAEVGDQICLIPSIVPLNASNQNLRWESSDSNIAYVEQNGKVNIVSNGTCIITVCSTDGSDVYASCSINAYASIDSLIADSSDIFDVFSIEGIQIMREISSFDIHKLSTGTYILRNKSKILKIRIP